MTRHRVVGAGVPLLVGALVLGLDLLEGPRTQFVGLLVAVPFFAAALVGPRLVAAVGAVTLAAAFGVGFLQRVSAEDDAPHAGLSGPQLVRLAFIAGAVAMAVGVSAVRLRREERIRRLSSVAAAAQLAILRPIDPVVGSVRCAVRYRAADEEAQLGGDLVELLAVGDGVRGIVGDVRGKGLDGVRLASRVLGAFREHAFSAPDLPALARDLDASVRRLAADEDFVTAALLEVGADGTTSVLLAGHPAPLLTRRGGTVFEPVETPALAPLGLLDRDDAAGAAAVRTLRLEAGDRLVVVTDGVLEARRDGRFFDLDAVLADLAAGPHGRPLDAWLDELMAALVRFVGGRLADDAAVLGIELAGLGPAEGVRPVGVTATASGVTAEPGYA